MGPGLVWMALAQGSGELIWWPYLMAKYGLGFLFLLVPACLLQLPLNVEIGRYTVLTGEGLFRGFLRMNRAYGLVLYALFILSFLWFGAFASAGGTALAELTQFPAEWSPKARTLLWGEASIALCLVGLLAVKVIYRLIEWVMKVVAIVTLAGMLLACLHPEARAVAGEVLRALFVPALPLARPWDPADATKLLTAITFAGLGGFWTTFYSYWLKEKRAGMAAHGSQLLGLRAGARNLSLGGGQIPEEAPDLAAKSRRWNRYLVVDSLVGILGNLVTTVLTCLLAFALLFPKGILPDGYQIAVVQAEFFQASWGAFGRVLFLFIAGAFLADTWLATVDAVARIHVDVLPVVWKRAETIGPQKLYYGFVALLTIVTAVTMLLDQPGELILLSAVLGFIGTVTYTTGLIVLNHRFLPKQLPQALRPSRLSLAFILLVWTAYALLMALYLRAQFFA
ncbi:MAG: Nramp family divalent metal transporter [Nitrospirae bacterium]|nr:Nramp family divalent metal transporter [Nitrospirota bacterium]